MSADDVIKTTIKERLQNYEDSMNHVWRRAQKNTESPIEALMYFNLWMWIDNSDIRVIREMNLETQKKIGKYRVDFLLTTEDRKVVVECDGHDFHEKTKQQAQRDKQRDRILTGEGYHVLRYTGSEIYNNPKCFQHDIWMIVDPIYHSLMSDRVSE